MMDRENGPEVIAAHEAGHVIVGLHLGMVLDGVDLTPSGSSLARVRFVDGQMPGLQADQRATMAFSGLAGQLVAGTYWNQNHPSKDIEWFLGGEQPNDSQGLSAARAILEEDLDRFETVRDEIFQGLASSAGFLSAENLLGAS